MDGGVVVPAHLAAAVGRWILAGVRAELAAERQRGGPPFPSLPYLALARDLQAVAGPGHDAGPPARLVAITEVARFGGRSARSLRRDAAAGRIPAVKAGHVWLIDTTGGIP